MADIAYRNEGLVYPVSRTNWGAIWIGVFTFVAIWSVFGILGEAIFASAANPNSAAPVSSMSVPLSIWAIILTIIAMYVAGRATGHFSGIADRTGRIWHGMAVFGLAVISVVLVVVLSGGAVLGSTGATSAPHGPYMLTVFSDVGWVGFASLFLGWLAVLGGAAHGPFAKTESRQDKNLRNAA